MPDSRWTRRRKKEDDEEPRREKESVNLNSQEHAWWAGRDSLDSQAVPRGRTKQPAEEPAKKSAFQEYYSTESLFVSTPDDLVDENDPYVVLGLPASASWEDITRAHRALAKRFHPDRLVDMSDEERAKGEIRIRDLNIAYTELRLRRGK